MKFLSKLAVALASAYLEYAPVGKAEEPDVDEIDAFLNEEYKPKGETSKAKPVEVEFKESQDAKEYPVKTSTIAKSFSEGVFTDKEIEEIIKYVLKKKGSKKESGLIEKLFDGIIEEEEREFGVDYTWYYAFHAHDGKRKYGRYQGVEIAGSNEDRDFWVRGAFLNGKNKDVINDYRVHLQMMMVPFQYCFNQHVDFDPLQKCDLAMTRVSLETRIGVGVGLHIEKTMTTLLPQESSASKLVGEFKIPHFDFPSDFHALAEVVGRVGLVEGRIGVNYGDLGVAWYLSSGARF